MTHAWARDEARARSVCVRCGAVRLDADAMRAGHGGPVGAVWAKAGPCRPPVATVTLE